MNDNNQNHKSYAVEMYGIYKRFGNVLANNNVDLKIQAGHIHGLVGENGAGKSTIMSILYGFYSADSGEILINGKPVQINQVEDAISNGVDMVHQHFMLVDNMSALENIVLGSEESFSLNKVYKNARMRLQELMDITGMKVNLDEKIEDLSVGYCQRVEILKTLFRGAKILILDEPTAVLTPQESLQLFSVLKKLRDSSTTIIIITHKLKEVMELCDEVTVMKNGQVVLDTTIKDTSIKDLATAMVGRSVSLERIINPDTHLDDETEKIENKTVLVAKNIQVIDNLGVVKLNNINLNLKTGEIVGIAGVSGNGQSELLEVLSGLATPMEGEISISTDDQYRFTSESWFDPKKARTIGIAHVPEDRYTRAMVMDFIAWEDQVLGYEYLSRYCRNQLMIHKNMQTDTQMLMDEFDVRPPNPELQCSQFSGGNQQKQILAREINQAPKILLIGQPTRGVDIGAIEFIHEQIRKLRNEGCAVLLVSSELDEIIALSDRVVVMNQGEITGELSINECNETKLGLLMSGGKLEPEVSQQIQ